MKITIYLQKQCYHLGWKVEKMKQVKIQNFQGQKSEEASGLSLLNSLGIKTSLGEVSLVGPLLF